MSNEHAGVVINPFAGRRTWSLVYGMQHMYPVISMVHGAERPGIVQPLEKATRSVIAVAHMVEVHAAGARSNWRWRQATQTSCGCVCSATKTCLSSSTAGLSKCRWCASGTVAHAWRPTPRKGAKRAARDDKCGFSTRTVHRAVYSALIGRPICRNFKPEQMVDVDICELCC